MATAHEKPRTRLPQDVKMDALLERRIVTAILDRLEKDTSNDVQSVCVKTLGILVRKVSEAQVQEICERLAKHLLEGRDELRDVYGIGLKTLISDAAPGLGPLVALTIVPRLLAGVQDPRQDVRCECLDVAVPLLLRFGTAVDKHHYQLLEYTLRLLLDASPGTCCVCWRKRHGGSYNSPHRMSLFVHCTCRFSTLPPPSSCSAAPPSLSRAKARDRGRGRAGALPSGSAP